MAVPGPTTFSHFRGKPGTAHTCLIVWESLVCLLSGSHLCSGCTTLLFRTSVPSARAVKIFGADLSLEGCVLSTCPAVAYLLGGRGHSYRHVLCPPLLKMVDSCVHCSNNHSLLTQSFTLWPGGWERSRISLHWSDWPHLGITPMTSPGVSLFTSATQGGNLLLQVLVGWLIPCFVLRSLPGQLGHQNQYGSPDESPI